MKVRRLRCSLQSAVVVMLAAASLYAADAWKWSGNYGDKAIELMILGDIQVQRRADPASAFTHMRETLTRADVVYANLEGVLVRSGGPEGDIPDKKWVNPGPEGAHALKANNIQVVGVANNVAYGHKNILETLKVLAANGIAHVGAGRNLEEAHKPVIVARKGVRIGFLQYTARWYREREQLAGPNTPGVARITSRDGISIEPSDLERMKNDIRKLRPQVDVVVVSHHNRDGGTPVQFGTPPSRTGNGQRADRTKAEEYQKQFARVALDTGADLAFGHGTHTVQGVEVYKGKPILYAIGHSAFDQPGYEDSKDGVVVRVVILDKRIARVSFVPVTRDEKNNVMMIDPTKGEGARLVGIIRGVSAGVPLPIEGQEVVLIGKSSGTS